MDSQSSHPLGLSLLATTGWGEEIYIYVFIYRKRENKEILYRNVHRTG